MSRQELEGLLADAYPFAKALATMLTRRSFDAEDLVQEAMAKALRSPPEMLNAATVRAWLRTTITRDYLATRRRAAADLKAMVRIFLEPPPVPATTQVADEMLTALRKLGPKQRACIVLRYVHDLSEAEVASTLGIADGTVKAHLAQGRERLRNVLGD